MSKVKTTDHIAAPQAWHAVRTSIQVCRKQLRECESARYGVSAQDGHPSAEEEYEAACDWLARRLENAHRLILLLVEQLGLPDFQSYYQEGFTSFADNLDGVETAEHDPEYLESAPLDYMVDILRSLSDSLEPETHEYGIDAIDQLHQLLKTTPVILDRSNIVPQSEKDVQKGIFDYLRILYPSARTEVGLSHVFKTFKADIGIDDLGVLIELKFINSPQELKSETPGIYEDMHGYKGDPRWKSHVALLYLTGPFTHEGELKAEFKLSECPEDWLPIMVVGEGNRLGKSK